MSRRTAVRAAAVACWGLALLPAMPATFGQEASPTLDGAGWWNKSQQVPAPVEQAPSLAPAPLPVTEVTVPPPPSVPEEGLYVANESSGPAAISAVRYTGGGSDGGTLTLTLAGSPATGQEPLAACPSPGGFTPEQNGRWDARPEYDEATCTVDGVFSEDNATVTFTLDSTFVGTLGDLQAVIVPKPGAAAPFQLAFEKPTNESLVPSGPPAGESEMPAFDSGAAFDEGTSTFEAPAPSESFGSFESPTSSFEAPATDAPEEVAVGETTPETPAAVTTAPAKPISENRTARYMAVGVLLAIGVAFWWLASQPERAPRLLGSLGAAARTADPAPAAARVAAVRIRGVGRFARPRTAPPTPI